MNLNIPQFYQGYVHAGVMLSVVDSTFIINSINFCTSIFINLLRKEILIFIFKLNQTDWRMQKQANLVAILCQ